MFRMNWTMGSAALLRIASAKGHLSCRALAATCCALLPLGAFGQTLWDQERDLTLDGNVSDGVSLNGSQLSSQSIADNFTLTGASTITGIEFWGGSEDFINVGLNNFKAFDVYVYNSTFSKVFSTQVTKAALSPADTGSKNTSGGEVYAFNLATSINLNAGNYWLHVGSIETNPILDSWIWAGSSTGDGVSAANFFDGTGWNTYTNMGDQAFKLSGSAAPEPASLTLLALGGITLLKRRAHPRLGLSERI